MIASESSLVSSLCCAPGSGYGLLISVLGLGDRGGEGVGGLTSSVLVSSPCMTEYGTVSPESVSSSLLPYLPLIPLLTLPRALIPGLGLTPLEHPCHLRQRAVVVRVATEYDLPPVAKLGVMVRFPGWHGMFL
ncbi:hypothetical protein L1987_08290 [Smallanthus sonchifolius]|uniref:Uncharacterized protein n=1 Tax=Smallanthus sonchifolius TaxID=185202 RepID=A0ACB9JKT3_9ASTR|nr:hypothetical protein L1987_08290 [Smallanthus sonchifolius]